MFFEPEPYFYNFDDKESSLKISKYNSCFKNGILLCPHLFYYLVIGSYFENLKNISISGAKFVLNDDEKIYYKALMRLFESIRNQIKDVQIFITPHIFTKFIHLLRDKKMDNKHYTNILDLLIEEFGYIQEEDIKKEEIIPFENFKNKYLGVSETALLILKGRREHPCILSTSGKILKEYKEDFLYINFQELISFVKEEERKSQLT